MSAMDAGPLPGSDAPVMRRRVPPVAELTVASMGLVIVGGIWMAAHLPGHPPLGPALGLLLGAVALLAVAVGLLARIRPFAWDRLLLVARWGFVAYLVIAGLLGFVFIKDGTRGSALALLLGMLAVFAVDVPLILGFTVARYQEMEPA
ncbi:MAG: hypothetical protein ACYCU7_05145 [Acidimicrobiales bacterium]